MIPAMLVLDIIPEFRLDIIPLDTIPFSCFILLSSSPHENVNSQLERIFQNFFHYQQWTISERPLARDELHGIAMAIDRGPLECHDHW